MTQPITEAQLRERLRAACDAAGGVRPFARAKKVQASEVCRALNPANKKSVGTAVAAAIGLTPVVLWNNIPITEN